MSSWKTLSLPLAVLVAWSSCPLPGPPNPLPRGWGRLAGCSGRAPYLLVCFGHEDFPVPERENFPVENVCVSNPYWSPHKSPLIPTSFSLIPGLPSPRPKKEGGTSGSGFRFPLWFEYLNPPRTPPKKSGSESWTNVQESSFVYVPLGIFIEDDMLPFLQGYSMYTVYSSLCCLCTVTFRVATHLYRLIKMKNTKLIKKESLCWSTLLKLNKCK